MILLLAACTQTPPHPTPFSACATPEGGFEAGTSDLAMSFSGTITDAGDGEAPESCASSVFGAAANPRADAAWWFEVPDDAGIPWTVGFWVPDGPVPPTIGDAVDLRVVHSQPGWGPTHAEVEVTVEGALLGWIGAASAVEDLAPPDGVDLIQGAVVAQDHNDCGSWSYHDLSATVDTETVDVPYGGIETVGDYQIRHGSDDQQDSGGGCPDWYVGRAAVALFPTP